MPCHFFSITENCDSMFRSRTTTFSIHMRWVQRFSTICLFSQWWICWTYGIRITLQIDLAPKISVPLNKKLNQSVTILTL
jgi:hypothetical protein